MTRFFVSHPGPDRFRTRGLAYNSVCQFNILMLESE